MKFAMQSANEMKSVTAGNAMKFAMEVTNVMKSVMKTANETKYVLEDSVVVTFAIEA